MLLALALMALQSPTIQLEFEDGVLTGPKTSTERSGFSGTGYVTDFTHGNDLVELRFRAKAGIYRAKVRYSAPQGEKGYDLTLNGRTYTGMFTPTGDAFADEDAGKVELKDGENVLLFGKGWGYYDVDAISFAPAGPVERLAVPPLKLSDPKASAATKKVFSSLARIYGKKTASGQYNEKDTKYIEALAGRTPLIFGDDLMDYSPSRVERGANPVGMAERLIARSKQGQIVTLSWHWNAPKDLVDTKTAEKDLSWYRGFYTEATTFDLANALEGEDRDLLVRDIDAIAVQLKKLAAADVPVLWRPLHEADGRWFWWGAKGPDPFKRLWRLMHDRLTNHHGLHNLIWVTSHGLRPDWYPGDDVVDIVGIDAYPSDPTDPLSTTWEELIRQYGGRKMLALTEFGGVPDVERARRFGVRWAYFVSWTGSLGPEKVSKEELLRLYRQKAVENLSNRK
ncbi:MAG TPA: glycosyl hydrolase [Fimbriimonas sp.]